VHEKNTRNEIKRIRIQCLVKVWAIGNSRNENKLIRKRRRIFIIWLNKKLSPNTLNEYKRFENARNESMSIRRKHQMKVSEYGNRHQFASFSVNIGSGTHKKNVICQLHPTRQERMVKKSSHGIVPLV
jgi:hypothetical protein